MDVHIVLGDPGLIEQSVCLKNTLSHSQELLYRPKILNLRSSFTEGRELEILLNERSRQNFAYANHLSLSGSAFTYNIYVLSFPLSAYHSPVSPAATLLFFLIFVL